MPLDPLQDQIARTALGLPEARTLALAGGGAMIAHGFVDRATKDVDLFTEIDDQEAVRIVVALRSALEEQQLTTRDTERPPLDHRFVTLIRTLAPSAPSKSSPTAAVSVASSPSTSAPCCTRMISPQTRCSLCGTAHDHATTSTSMLCSNATVRIDCSNSRLRKTAELLQ